MYTQVPREAWGDPEARITLVATVVGPEGAYQVRHGLTELTGAWNTWAVLAILGPKNVYVGNSLIVEKGNLHINLEIPPTSLSHILKVLAKLIFLDFYEQSQYYYLW